jgi:hypothetical protein
MERMKIWLTRSGSWERLAVTVWTGLLLGVFVHSLLAPQRSVYPIFSEAARHWLSGQKLYGSVETPYRYSPLATTLFIPFSLLPDRAGGLLWRVLNAAVFLGALAWWSRVALPFPLTKGQHAFLFLLVIPLALGSLNNGQSNPLILGLMLAGMACVVRQRWNAASSAIALACLFKIYPIALGSLVMVIHPRRFAGRFLLALALGLSLPMLLQLPQYVVAQNAGWFEELAREDRQSEPPEFWYRDLRLLCHTCHIPLDRRAYLAIQLTVAAAMAALCVVAYLRRMESRRLFVMVLGLACCWMTLFGPATESCTYILLAPSLAWALISPRMNRQPPLSISTSLLPSPPVLLGRGVGGEGGRTLQSPAPSPQPLSPGVPGARGCQDLCQPTWIFCLLLASYGLFTAAAVAVWFPGSRQFHTLGPHPLAALLFLISLMAVEFRWLFNTVAQRDQITRRTPSQAA